MRVKLKAINPASAEVLVTVKRKMSLNQTQKRILMKRMRRLISASVRNTRILYDTKRHTGSQKSCLRFSHIML